MTAWWRHEISLLALKKYFSTLEEKLRISARPCNIFYVFTTLDFNFGLFFTLCDKS